ncbi:HSP20 family protein [Tenacibaculum adriaticum]|uniref:HSP20 family protein n=1 Tax=Tenacibaculum adriaticum TaxID=413713 RepID=A0A5S5DWB9_9FLAO|nr:Hsp20/alpha crystallin family protein [Tenacibaculum adriaticum]TYQ00271.1 HSP20 family protein [Tenacibaculum adriaticum]
MTTLAKTKRRNRFLSPWSNESLLPWNDNFFSSRFKDLMKLDDAFKDDFFEDDSLMPAMNVKENKKDFDIEFAAPGFNKEDFEVSIENDVLHVSAKKEKETKEEEDNYSRKEFSYKSFQRSSSLPNSVDLDQDVKASYKNGILKVKLLKNEKAEEEKSSKKVIEVK